MTMTQRYIVEREAFDNLRSACTPKAQSEYENALRLLVHQYNTTIRENRFIVGGVTKDLTYKLLRSVGIHCTFGVEDRDSGDILLGRNRRLRVKSSFSGVSHIRLMNKMSPGDRHWNVASLFVVSGVGLVFGAPDMVQDRDVVNAADGIDLTESALYSLIDDENNVLEMNIPSKPPSAQAGRAQLASMAVARQVLNDISSEILVNFGD